MPRPKPAFEKRGVGWKLPVDLIERLTDYAQQTHRSTSASAVDLIEKGLKAAAKRGEYTPTEA